MDKLTKKGLDGTQLKTIALVLMVLDHIHYFFEFTGWSPPCSVCWGGSVRRCSCSARWRALPTPMTAGGILSASGLSVQPWRPWNFL